MAPDPKINNLKLKKYLDFIKTKPSLKSGRPGTPDNPIVPSHQGFGKKGTGLKAPDTHAVPLLWSEHQEFEHQNGGKTFWSDQYEALPLRCLEFVTEFLALRN